MKQVVKTVVASIIMVTCLLALSGCGDNIFDRESTEGELDQFLNYNRELVNKLYNGGIITQGSLDTFETSFVGWKRELIRYLEGIEGSGGSVDGAREVHRGLIETAPKFTYIDVDGSEKEGHLTIGSILSGESSNSNIVTVHIPYDVSISDVISMASPGSKGSEKQTPDPYKLFNANAEKFIVDALQFDLKVIAPQSEMHLANLISTINKYNNSNRDNEDEMNGIFMNSGLKLKVTDARGNEIPLMIPYYINLYEQVDIMYDTRPMTVSAAFAVIEVMGINPEYVNCVTNYVDDSAGPSNSPRYLISKDAKAAYLTEYRLFTIDKIGEKGNEAATGSDGGSTEIDADTSSSGEGEEASDSEQVRSEIEEDAEEASVETSEEPSESTTVGGSESNRKIYETSFKESGLLINLATGEMYKKSANGAVTPISQVQDYIYMLTRTQLDDAEGNKKEGNVKGTDYSFNTADTSKYTTDQNRISCSLYGLDETILDYIESLNIADIGEATAESMGVPKIVLNDYFETLYIPNSVLNTTENWVNTGRKIRFIRFEGGLYDGWAYYADNGGYLYKNANLFQAILLNDIIDKKSDVEGEELTYYKLSADSTDTGRTGGVTGGGSSNDDSSSEEGVEGEEDTEETSDELDEAIEESKDAPEENVLISRKLSVIDVLEPVIQFPSEQLGVNDFINESTMTDRALLFCIKVDKHPSKTALNSTWINSKSAKNSVAWWNSWLAQNKFNYRVDLNTINYILSNQYEFKYKDPNSPNIMVNMDTVTQLQAELDAKQSQKSVSLIKTVFIVLGILLLFYGITIICAWSYDVNMVIGPRVLTVVTGGKWVAIKDYEDMPDANGKIYITFGRAVVSSAILMGFGILFTSFDILAIIAGVVQALSDIPNFFEELLF